MQIEIINLKNEKVGTVELPKRWFGAPWRPALITQVLHAQQANRRIPWAHAKDRSEVRGGGRKPWKQKGTGRARHGSIRSPIWIGGGKAHGPLRERDYSQKINKKMRREALASVLSKKLRDQEIKVIDMLVIDPPKTKIAAIALRAILGLSLRDKKFDALLIRDPERKELTRAARNLVKIKVINPESMNIEDVLRYKHVVFDRQAIEALREKI